MRVTALNSVDLPTLGSPTIQALSIAGAGWGRGGREDEEKVWRLMSRFLSPVSPVSPLRIDVQAPRIDVQALRIDVQALRIDVQAPRIDVQSSSH